MKKTALFPVILGLLVSGCSMIPDYARPDFAAAPQWQDMSGYETPENRIAAQELAWQEFFRSEDLQKVIGIALENNKDLHQAALNIREARAQYNIERSDIVPNFDANAGAAYQQTPEEASPTGQEQNTELYEVNLGLSAWELDLFGRLRSQSEAALNDYLATEQARDVVRNVLIAETANAWLQLRADRKLLAVTENTLAAQENTHRLLSRSMEQGAATAIDVARAATAMETARVNLHEYRRLVAQDKNALITLMGVEYDESLIPAAEELATVDIADNLEAGIPSGVLLRRPDVKKAEYELRARNADIGAARAAFFPRITLTGSYGLASEGLSQLFTGGAAGAWSFLPQMTVPVFQGGRNQANMDIAEIRKEKAIVNYEQTIQTAFREVADELAARSTLTAQLEAQERLVEAARTVYEKSDARYKAGIDNFLSVLDAQRELYTAEQNEILIKRQQLSNMVNLYKTLGGGVGNDESPIKDEQVQSNIILEEETASEFLDGGEGGQL